MNENFTHLWVDGFGWENTIYCFNDFDEVKHVSGNCFECVFDTGSKVLCKIDKDVKITIPCNDIKRHMVDGDMVAVQNVQYVNPNKIEIKWYDYEGHLLDKDYDGRVPSYMFLAIIDGIDPESIVSLEYPQIAYTNEGDYLVKVTTNVYENSSYYKKENDNEKE